jgi:pimeloyl-ACP methyl ester carboxylesterase
MGRCILALYRSAAQPALRDLAAGMGELAQRGLVIIATGDHYAGTPEMAAHTAAKLAARTVTFEGPGHWWMLEAPDTAADALVAFWSGA